MEYIGIDLHKKDSQVCILTEEGAPIEKRIRTERGRFTELLSRPKARILIEASTESEWVARHLEGLGHEVIVADPNFAPMYASRSRRVKTDKRDARTLAEACRLGAFRPAHRLSEAQRHVRGRLGVRDVLVQTRSRYISLVRALVRSHGLRIPGGSAETFVERLQQVPLPGALKSQVGPLLAVMVHLNQQIAFSDKVLAQEVARSPTLQLLSTAPGVGPVVSTAFVATLDEAKRFHGAHQVESFLGLVPSEKSSGEKQNRGAITRAGSSRMRGLLVQSAWTIIRSRSAETAKLRNWAAKVALRRGKNVAVVAVARRLAGILFAMWRDGKPFQAERLRSSTPPAAAAAA